MLLSTAVTLTVSNIHSSPVQTAAPSHSTLRIPDHPSTKLSFLSNKIIDNSCRFHMKRRSDWQMSLGSNDRPRSKPSFFIRSKIPRNFFRKLFGFWCWTGVGQKSFNYARALSADTSSASWTKNERKKILILLSDTGGGHKASAKAIQAALDLLFPGVFTCEIADIWTDHAPFPFNTFVGSYQWAAKNPWAWRIMYYSAAFPPAGCAYQEWARLVCSDSFQRYMESFKPDAVVSVHPLCQEVPLRVLERMGGGQRKIPFVTVVTDLGGAHPTWFNKRVDRCFVPGDAVEKLALSKGLSPSQVQKHGLPVREGFWDAGKKRTANQETRRRLGLQNIPTVLVVGGGDGVGGLEKTAVAMGEALGNLGRPCQMVVVCGKNDKVRESLSRRAWAPGVSVAVQGFVSNMDDWMVAADCLVTKAGPGTIAEASILGLPTMLSSYLPGQEAGNVPYVVDSGFGDFEGDPIKLAEKVTALLADEARLKRMSACASAVGTVHSLATKEIAREIARLVLVPPGL